MVVHGYEIVRADIPKYLSRHAYEAINVWKSWTIFGMPFAGGWAEQPAVYWDVIETLEMEARKRQQEAHDARGK